MTHDSIKNSITSLKNKLFSFFKIKDKSKNVVNANVTNKNDLNKITYDYSSKEMDVETKIEMKIETKT